MCNSMKLQRVYASLEKVMANCSVLMVKAISALLLLELKISTGPKAWI